MITEAVKTRINQLCADRGITLNDLANISGITPSTIYSILAGKSANPGIVTIKKLCDGLGITIVDFFDCELFLGLEQEII